MTPQETHNAFVNTTFKVLSNPNFDIYIDKIIPEVENLESWAFLSAWNPSPEVYTVAINKQRNQELEKDINDLKLDYYEGIGISEDQQWSEESFFIKNISKEQTQKLALKFGQLAFVYGYKNKPAELVYTN